MASLSIWVNMMGQAPRSWEPWAALRGPNVTVGTYGGDGSSPENAGDEAWVLLGILASLASEVQAYEHRGGPTADWTLLVPANCYAHLPALRERLACLDPDEPSIFARLNAGRLQPLVPKFRGGMLPAPFIRAGVVVNRALLAQTWVAQLGTSACSHKEMLYLAKLSEVSIRDKGALVPSTAAGAVGLTVADLAVGWCFSMLSAPLANFASYLDHYVLGEHAVARLAFRAAYARPPGRPGAQFEPGAAPPCVIFTWPAPWAEAHAWADALWRRGCGARALRPVTLEEAKLVGNTMFNMDDDEYAMHEGRLDRRPYYPGAISARLDACDAPRAARPPPGGEPGALTALLQSKVRARVLLLLGLPGGATTWFRDVLQEVLEPLGATLVPDLFHPYCHESIRAEMALLLGAPEDYSAVNIWRPPGRGDELALPSLASWALGGAELAITKEIINVARVAQFRGLGLTLFGLYRHRRHTFPVSDRGPTARDFCRTCWYEKMYRSFETQPPHPPALAALRTLLQELGAPDRGASEEERAVLLHTAVWYLLLREGVPVIRYEVLVRGTLLEVHSEVGRVLRPLLLLLLVLPGAAQGDGSEEGGPGATALVARANGTLQALARRLLATRQPAAWLTERETRYDSLGVEGKVGRLLHFLRLVDPATDLRLLA